MNKILIIDDDRELCALIKRSVQSEHIEVCLISTLSVALFCKLFHVGMVYGMAYKIFMSLIFGVLIVAASFTASTIRSFWRWPTKQAPFIVSMALC